MQIAMKAKNQISTHADVSVHIQVPAKEMTIKVKYPIIIIVSKINYIIISEGILK